jgi:hypothetical protein
LLVDDTQPLHCDKHTHIHSHIEQEKIDSSTGEVASPPYFSIEIIEIEIEIEIVE